MKRDELVILLHGLGLSSGMMLYLKRGIEHSGYKVVNIDYPSRAYNISDLLDVVNGILSQKHSSLEQFVKVHFIGHSLGGILARLWALEYRSTNLGCCIALGSPNRGSLLAKKLIDYRLVRGYFGPALPDLLPDSDFINSFNKLPRKYFLFVGERSTFTLFGNWLERPNDGTLMVREMIPAGLAEKYVFTYNVSHTSMLFSKDIRTKIIKILNDGC